MSVFTTPQTCGSRRCAAARRRNGDDHDERDAASDQLAAPRAEGDAFVGISSGGVSSPSSRTLPAYDPAHEAVDANGHARAGGDVRDRPRVVRHRRPRGGRDPARRPRRPRRSGADRPLRRDGRFGDCVARSRSRATGGRSVGARRDPRAAAGGRAGRARRCRCGAARPLREAGGRSALPPAGLRPQARPRPGRSGWAIRTTWRAGPRLSPGGSAG